MWRLGSLWSHLLVPMPHTGTVEDHTGLSGVFNPFVYRGHSPMRGPMEGSDGPVEGSECADLYAESVAQPPPLGEYPMTPEPFDKSVSSDDREMWEADWESLQRSPKPSTPPRSVASTIVFVPTTTPRPPKPSTPLPPSKQAKTIDNVAKASWRMAPYGKNQLKEDTRDNMMRAVLHGNAAATPKLSITPPTMLLKLPLQMMSTPMSTIASGSEPSIASRGFGRSVSMPSDESQPSAGFQPFKRSMSTPPTTEPFMFLWCMFMDNTTDQQTDHRLDNAITTGASLFFNADFDMYKQHVLNTVADTIILKSFPGNTFANRVMNTDWYS